MIFTKYSLNYMAIFIFYVFCFTALFFLPNKQSLQKAPSLSYLSFNKSCVTEQRLLME